MLIIIWLGAYYVVGLAYNILIHTIQRVCWGNNIIQLVLVIIQQHSLRLNPHSHVGDEESDQVRGHKIKHGVLDMHLGHGVPVSKAEDVVWRHNLVEGVLENETKRRGPLRHYGRVPGVYLHMMHLPY